MNTRTFLLGCVALIVSGCATIQPGNGAATARETESLARRFPAPVAIDQSLVSDAAVATTLRASFKEGGVAKLDRLDQSELQRACSIASTTGKDLDAAVRDTLQSKALAAVKYPADGKFLGDWKRGETIAQSGRGLQFSDTASTVAGGNCYACHQINQAEISYGNIGPTLWNYGKLRGTSEPILKYTWARIWNSHAFNACANMPRFGDAGILTEAQIKDVMALLLDPDSPVNK